MSKGLVRYRGLGLVLQWPPTWIKGRLVLCRERKHLPIERKIHLWHLLLKGNFLVVEYPADPDLALFARLIKPGDEFDLYSETKFLWRDYGDDGGWFFNFKSLEDMQSIW